MSVLVRSVIAARYRQAPSVPLLLGVVSLAVAQEPSQTWEPNQHSSLGLTCAKDAPNPNDPSSHSHNGGCGCENTLLRIDGQLVLMESASHGLDDVFPHLYNSSAQGDNSYFRMRDFRTGIIIANVSESIGHSFCAAVADHARRQVWVFCGANARGNKKNPGPCGVSPRRGCYVGAWNASFDDLTTWSPTRKALTLPDGTSLFNNDVALVQPPPPGQRGADVAQPRRHQAAMIIEGRADKGTARPGPFAINVGSDGDLGANWIILDPSKYSFDGIPKGAAGEGTGDAPSLRYDSEQGYYYSIGGGWITNGPVRSKTLAIGSWEVSPLAPMAVPDARAAAVGIPASDEARGINTDYFTAVWATKGALNPTNRAFAKNLSSWAWGATDPDLCCSDGGSPSYLLNTLSRQGTPAANATDAQHSYGFARFRVANLTLNDWLRSYFPKPATIPRATKAATASHPTVIVWMDNDSGNNTRPDHGWWPMNPNDPFTVPSNGQFRTMTSKLGLYSSLDPLVARQHAYQLIALGARAVIVDWTNCVAQREQTGGMLSYCDGIRSSTSVLLREWSTLRVQTPAQGGFQTPKLMVAIRMPDMVNTTRTDWLADEVFSLHQQFPEGMVRVEDGSANATKPALLAFIAPNAQNGWLTAPRWFDRRFNVRYTNGFISSWKNVTTTENADWSYTDLPYWNFIEVLPRTDKPGFYRNLYRRRVSENKAVAEQSAIWCAGELCDAPAGFHAPGEGCCGAGRPTPCRAVDGWAWDGWSNLTNGL